MFSPFADIIRIGIGLMMVKALEENGAKVYVVGRRKEMLDKVAREESVRLSSVLWSIYHMCVLIFTVLSAETWQHHPRPR
jgi:NAD(P)-dependent dehydrogenase (short-subunit alcohol dehydrogenase family)